VVDGAVVVDDPQPMATAPPMSRAATTHQALVTPTP
jgi:hypothetical protein